MTLDEFRERQSLLKYLEERCIGHALVLRVVEMHASGLSAIRSSTTAEAVEAAFRVWREDRSSLMADVTSARSTVTMRGELEEYQGRARMLERAAFGEGYLWPLMHLHLFAIVRLDRALRGEGDTRIPFEADLDRWGEGRWSLIERGKL